MLCHTEGDYPGALPPHGRANTEGRLLGPTYGMNAAMKSLAAVLGYLLLIGCAAPPVAPACLANSTLMRVFEVYFGRSIDGRGNVTDAEWNSFRTEVITFNLPDGYTVLDATGAWLDPKTHTTISEPTKILVAAMPDTLAATAAIERVRSAYQRKFKQNSVGMTTHLACSSFD